MGTPRYGPSHRCCICWASRIFCAQEKDTQVDDISTDRPCIPHWCTRCFGMVHGEIRSRRIYYGHSWGSTACIAIQACSSSRNGLPVISRHVWIRYGCDKGLEICKWCLLEWKSDKISENSKETSILLF